MIGSYSRQLVKDLFPKRPSKCERFYMTDTKGSIQLIGNWTKTTVVSKIQGLNDKIPVDSYKVYGDNLAEVNADSFILIISLSNKYDTKAEFVFTGDGTDVIGNIYF